MADIEREDDQPDHVTYYRLIHTGLGHLAAALAALAEMHPTGAPQVVAMTQRATRDFALAGELFDRANSPPEPPPPETGTA